MKNNQKISNDLGHNCYDKEDVKEMIRGMEMEKRDEIREMFEQGIEIEEKDLRYLDDDWEEELEEELEEGFEEDEYIDDSLEDVE